MRINKQLLARIPGTHQHIGSLRLSSSYAIIPTQTRSIKRGSIAVPMAAVSNEKKCAASYIAPRVIRDNIDIVPKLRGIWSTGIVCGQGTTASKQEFSALSLCTGVLQTDADNKYWHSVVLHR